MDQKDTVVNSCRICRNTNQDGDFECLFDDNFLELSTTGQLYEELVGLHIEKTSIFYPLYLCKTCDLQIKLFKKLKTKAIETIEILRAVNSDTLVDDSTEDFQTNQKEVGFEIKTEDLPQQEIYYGSESEVKFEGALPEQRGVQLDYEELLEEGKQVAGLQIFNVIETLEPEDISGCQLKSTLKDEYDSANIDCSEDHQLYDRDIHSEENKSEIEHCDFAQIINENSEQTCLTVDNNEVFVDVHYLDDALDDPELSELLKEKANKKANENDKRNYCRICKMPFLNRSDFLKHKKNNHSIKYPCDDCGKVFQTADGHNAHQKLHLGLPAYTCDICSKTFKQKVHYNYHMAMHNNIRNFKCEICGKAFIAKGDLAIHKRTHTGDRRYSCDICQKEFLLHIHMKNHRYSHFEKEFECKICQQKFVSPTTLRTHTRTIHENEPSFECAYCVKRFRRKHHLTAHHKVHRKQFVEQHQLPIYEIILEDDFSNNVTTEEFL